MYGNGGRRKCISNTGNRDFPRVLEERDLPQGMEESLVSMDPKERWQPTLGKVLDKVVNKRLQYHLKRAGMDKQEPVRLQAKYGYRGCLEDIWREGRK